jgi:hypothetical protein
VVAALNRLSPWAEKRRKAAEAGRKPLFNNIFFRSPDELNACAPYKGAVKTAIHFQEDDNPGQAEQIEARGRKERLDTGAFLVICWEKYNGNQQGHTSKHPCC